MISNIIVNKHKYFDSIKMESLGCVAVVCGKNNSGKTRLLETIANEGQRYQGVTVSEEFFNAVADEFIDVVKKRTGRNFIKIKVVSELNRYFDGIRVIYPHDITDEGFSYGRSFVGGFENTDYKISNVIKAVCRKTHSVWPETILIPSKRSIPYAEQLDTISGVDPSGLRLLSRLHVMKTSLRGSKELIAYNKIHDNFTYVTNGTEFGITFSSKEVGRLELYFSQQSEPHIIADSCGMGYRDLLLLLYFINDDNIKLLLIDEPENHMHPDMQRRLTSIIKKTESKQFILATHSNIFVSSDCSHRQFYVEKSVGKTASITVSDRSSIAAMMSDIGYTVADNLHADLTVMVEGPSDIHIYKRIFDLYEIDKQVSIRFFPLIGDNMQHYDIKSFMEDGKVVVITDRDPNSDDTRRIFFEDCARNGVEVFRLSGMAIENYYPIKAIKELVKSAIVPEGLTRLALDKPVYEQIGVKLKGNARKFAEKIERSDVDSTDIGKTIMPRIHAIISESIQAKMTQLPIA